VTLNLDKSTWKRVAFGDVIESVTDRVDDPSKAGVDRYVGLEHLDPGVMTVQRWDSPDKVEAQKLRFRKGDVIFGRRRAYQKKVALAEFEGICSAHALVLRARADYIDPGFLPVFLSSDYFLDRSIAISVGSLSPTVNWRDLKVQEFILPPLDEQKRIADLLWAIERHRLAVASQTLAVERLADELFGSALATTPAEQVLLPKLMNEMTVGVVVRPTQHYTDDQTGVPALRGLNIRPGEFDLADLVRFRPESAAELKKSTLGVGDVAIVRTGRPGDAAVVTDEIAGFNCIDLIIARPDSTKLVPDFLAHFLNSSYGRSQISRLSAGTAQQHFNVGALKKLEIPYLAVDGQEELVRRVEGVRGAARVSSAEMERLHTLRNSVLADVFGGN
jgi:hypothetical protein